VQELQESLMTVARGAVLAGMSLREYRKCTERQLLIEVLTSVEFNQCEAARILGVHRNTLSRAVGGVGLNVNKLRLERCGKKPVAAAKPAVSAAAVRAMGNPNRRIHVWP
jgi:hypothetical protein